MRNRNPIREEKGCKSQQGGRKAKADKLQLKKRERSKAANEAKLEKNDVSPKQGEKRQRKDAQIGLIVYSGEELKQAKKQGSPKRRRRSGGPTEEVESPIIILELRKERAKISLPTKLKSVRAKAHKLIRKRRECSLKRGRS